jgi:Tol biopolymer transport system component
MKTDGSAQTRLTLTGNNYGSRWSPDSSKIVWSRNDGLYTMKANGSSQTQLTHNVGPLVLDAHPSWSPDGSLIVFDTSRSGNNDLWVVKPDGTGMQQITVNPASDLDPSWR